MPSSDVSRGRQILNRFLTLAEERLAYLVELYETNRWQRYFTQDELLANVRDAKKAVTAWKLLVSTEALPSNRAVDLGWLDSARPLPPRKPLMLHRDQQPAKAAMPIATVAAASVAVPYVAVAPPIAPPVAPVRIDFRNGVEPIRLHTPPPVPAPVLAASSQPPSTVSKAPAWQNALDFALMRERYPLLRKTG